MTDALDRPTAAIEEADAGTDALCAEYFAGAMDSVRDLLDGSNGGYVAPQNRAEMPRLVVQPLAMPPGLLRVDLEAMQFGINRMVEAFRQTAATLGQAVTASDPMAWAEEKVREVRAVEEEGKWA